MAFAWSNQSINTIQLSELYEWLDKLPLSKPRVYVEKDFADAYLAAELVKYYLPDLVDMRWFKPAQNIQDRLVQWKVLNKKVLNKMGLNIPSHVITQLSIGKTGVAQVFLNNLRASLIICGANLGYVVSMPLVAEPLITASPLLTHPIDDAHWFYADRANLLNNQGALIYPDHYNYYWQKKQVERVLKSAKVKKLPGNTANNQKSFSHPSLRKPNTFPPLIKTYVPTTSSIGFAAAKLELDEKNQRIIEKEDQVQYLRGQLKRMEVILQNKNSKIQELLLELEKKQNSNNNKK